MHRLFLQSCLTPILCKRDSGLRDLDFRMQSGDSFQSQKRFGFARFGRGGAAEISRWDELKRLRSRCAVAAGGRAGRRVRSGCFACAHPTTQGGRFSFAEPCPCVFAIASGRSNFRGWTGGGTYGRMRRWSARSATVHSCLGSGSARVEMGQRPAIL